MYYQWSYQIRLLSIALFATLLLPSALLAENAKFEGATGTLSIPAVEVSNPFGGTDCYRLQMTLSNSEKMDFSLTQADPITCPTLSASGVSTPTLKPPTTPTTPTTAPTASCQNPGTPSYNQCQTGRLRGTWSFTYNVGTNTLTYVYTLTEVEESTSSPGEYNIWGTNRGGELILAKYYPDDNDFSLLEMTAIVNRYFRFTFSSNDTVSGCAFHIDADMNFSDCYAMTGTRTSRTAREGIRDDVSIEDADQSVYEQLMRELGNNIR